MRFKNLFIGSLLFFVLLALPQAAFAQNAVPTALQNLPCDELNSAIDELTGALDQVLGGAAAAGVATTIASGQNPLVEGIVGDCYTPTPESTPVPATSSDDALALLCQKIEAARQSLDLLRSAEVAELISTADEVCEPTVAPTLVLVVTATATPTLAAISTPTPVPAATATPLTMDGPSLEIKLQGGEGPVAVELQPGLYEVTANGIIVHGPIVTTGPNGNLLVATHFNNPACAEFPHGALILFGKRTGSNSWSCHLVGAGPYQFRIDATATVKFDYNSCCKTENDQHPVGTTPYNDTGVYHVNLAKK